MTRIEFLDKLCQGLKGLPPAALKEIMADYEAHFKDAAADGRNESEVAEALGDPTRLARELRAEMGVKGWDEAKTPSSATSAIVGILGLGALDILVLLPLAGGVFGTLIGVFAASIGTFIAGGSLFAIGPFIGLPGGVFASLLAGFGVMLASAAIGAVTLALTIWLVNGLVWYARLHYRVLKPALEA